MDAASFFHQHCAVDRQADSPHLPGWSVAAERGTRAFLAGTRALVDAPEQPTHRHLADVQAIIGRSGLAPAVQERSLRVFARLAEAEGQRIAGSSADAMEGGLAFLEKRKPNFQGK